MAGVFVRQNQFPADPLRLPVSLEESTSFVAQWPAGPGGLVPNRRAKCSSTHLVDACSVAPLRSSSHYWLHELAFSDMRMSCPNPPTYLDGAKSIALSTTSQLFTQSGSFAKWNYYGGEVLGTPCRPLLRRQYDSCRVAASLLLSIPQET